MNQPPRKSFPRARLFLIESQSLDELATRFVSLKQLAEAAFADGGASAKFMSDAKAMSMCYVDLMSALGIHPTYAVSSDGKRMQLVVVDQSMGRTILGVPDDLHFSSEEVRSISYGVYETMRAHALGGLGVTSAAL